MMNNFPLIHTVRIACSVDETVLCTVYAYNSRFVGLLLHAVILRIFISNHILFLVLMNVMLLTERSDRCLQTLWSENVLSVNGMVRTAVAGPAPFLPFFAVFYTVQNA
ncbi:hypothetical protein B5864_16455 [Salmonella enterica]|uniref:Uncharacterized protein n=2 Tax=Salmonella enterica TaxID=28901 RepID=A0A403T7B7_SALER|nr:hypothetical protein [Salmonella sp. SG203]EAB7740818.1 hypothetical protein [Salmonella enterica subsp. enterica serovar Hadar]EAV6572626.1 hypothetical protein [Salmonella enterica]EBQ9005134.1 hypothetical protein [Salmonella enterica subsp. enterica serovar Blockley]EBR8260585.1 hypothetical protein [Salmonella enterica subsp. enterica serovar Cerro]EBW7256020.1 hypothetical protein [Salmonella enterica subsp. enterica serovar Gatow]EBX7467738.1 hypothetical protein [Salmonella enteric